MQQQAAAATFPSNNILELALEEYDAQLVQFTKYFEETPAGQLLRDVVFDLSVYPAVAAPPGVAPGMQGRVLRTVLTPLEGYPKASPQLGSLFLTSFISLLCVAAVVPFCYFGVYGGLKEYSMYSWASIAGYAALSLSLSALHGVMPELAVALICLLIGGAVGYLTFTSSMKQQASVCTFISCLLASNVVLALWAGIPYDTISPAFCGVAGLLFNTGFANHYFYALRLLHFTFLVAVAGLIYLTLPPYVKDAEPLTTEERERARNWNRYLTSLSFAWVVAGALTQLIYLFGASSSPLDPLSTFYIPSQLQWSKWESFVAILVWAGLTYFFAFMRQKEETELRFDSRAVPRDVMEQWKLMGAEA